MKQGRRNNTVIYNGKSEYNCCANFQTKWKDCHGKIIAHDHEADKETDF